MFLSSPKWRKVLLTVGLLLVLVQGLLRLPEVRGRLSPGLLWEMKLRLAQHECVRVERRLKYLESTLEALSGPQTPGGPLSPAGPFGELLVLAQGWAHLLELWSRLLPQMSYETKLRLAQKECIKTETSLKYISATVEALKRGLEHRPPQGATGSMLPGFGLNQALTINQAMRQRCGEYKQELENLLQKWQELKVNHINKVGLNSPEVIRKQKKSWH